MQYTRFLNEKNEYQVKLKLLFIAIFKPILTYGCVTWVVNRRSESKIQPLEIKYWRGVKGVTLRQVA